jgi:2-isopropylmalate synthase
MAYIKIFDTTLRDGEQSPGVALNTKEKVEIARQLARLGVDVIEAGFPIASPGDFEAVRAIASAIDQESDKVVVAGLARANQADIERAAAAVEKARNPRIHTFIATSPIHMEKKLRLTPDAVVERAIQAVTLAKSFVNDVEFSAEDAGRSDPEFLIRIFIEAVKAGATTINIPDTVGYLMPWEYGELVRTIIAHVPNEGVTFSTHCHDDLGCAVINSLAGVKAGATQVECTINGIGERAGNASLEEVVMAIYTRRDFWTHQTGINTRELYRTSRLVSSLTGMVVPPNKAVVGDNAFAHESGIHQDGVIKAIETYEIMSAELVGRKAGELILGKHSGRNAFKQRLRELGYEGLDDEQVNTLFKQFKDLADLKQAITNDDIRALVDAETTKVAETYRLAHLQFQSGTGGMTPQALVRLETPEGIVEATATGSGPVDASYKALRTLTPLPLVLERYDLKAIGSGTDALGEVSIRVRSDGQVIHGRAISTDVVHASVLAYVDVLNKLAAGLGRIKVSAQQITAL